MLSVQFDFADKTAVYHFVPVIVHILVQKFFYQLVTRLCTKLCMAMINTY